MSNEKEKPRKCIQVKFRQKWRLVRAVECVYVSLFHIIFRPN